MYMSGHRPSRRRPPSAGGRAPIALALTLLLLAVGATALPAPTAASSGGWTTPKRVFTHSSAPSHQMVVDGAGKVHIATDRGSGGVWYVTNASGSWEKCQVSDDDDRWPSIAIDGGVIHIAFARLTDGQKGIYTASSDQLGSGSECDWTVSRRSSGGAGGPSMGARGGSLSIAFEASNRKLRFIKGPASVTDWTLDEVIDGRCCTSPVALVLTNSGAPRVAYGAGTSKAKGLKYGVRTNSGWKRSTAHGGRVKHVAMALDQTPGLFGQPPSNAPHIAFAVKKKGTFVSVKGSSGASGRWEERKIARAVGPLDLTHHSNVSFIVYATGGDLRYARASGGIWSGGMLSRGSSNSRPQVDDGRLTFTRQGTNAGIYYTRPK